MGADRYGLQKYSHFFEDPEDRAPGEQWKLRAKCLDTGALTDEIFFPDLDLPKDEVRERTRRAKRFCKGQGGTGIAGDDGTVCKAIDDCLAYAMENGLWHGVWGGTSYRERRKRSAEWQPVSITPGSKRPTR